MIKAYFTGWDTRVTYGEAIAIIAMSIVAMLDQVLIQPWAWEMFEAANTLP